jgi:hypothetical protein
MAEASGRNFERKHGPQRPAAQTVLLFVLKLDSEFVGPLHRSTRRLIGRAPKLFCQSPLLIHTPAAITHKKVL